MSVNIKQLLVALTGHSATSKTGRLRFAVGWAFRGSKMFLDITFFMSFNNRRPELLSSMSGYGESWFSLKLSY